MPSTQFTKVPLFWLANSVTNYPEYRLSGMCSVQSSNVKKFVFNVVDFTQKGNGVDVGLTVILSPDANEYVSYSQAIYGIDVAIHNRESFDTGNFFTVQPGYIYEIFVSPSVLMSDENVRALPSSQRNCLFDDEVSLVERFSCFIAIILR